MRGAATGAESDAPYNGAHAVSVIRMATAAAAVARAMNAEEDRVVEEVILSSF
jgi:hypothetical protein